MPEFAALSEAVVAGEGEKVKAETEGLLGAGAAPREVIEKGLIAGMDMVGERFRKWEIFIPDVLFAARAMQEGMAVVRPHLSEGELAEAGRVVLGTVKGDVHDIGKKLVGMMLEGAGFEVTDLGTDVEPAAFVEAVKDGKANIIGMSALLTTTMVNMKETVEALKESGLRDNVKVMIGGAAVSEEYAEEIGADGHGADAAAAVELARRFIAERSG
ncbi:MAG: corrinoid protein [Armatimonadota bacterium]|nr:MAG: corrinoid protein [Armatimonadota bacterium]